MHESCQAQRFFPRFVIAVVTAMIPIFISSAALHGFSYESVDLLYAAAALIAFALPAGLVAALVFKRSGAGLVVGAQLITAAGMWAFMLLRVHQVF